ncbi:MAG: hypothetical protein V1809_06025 [Planctomycetota bacterium]
MIMRALKFRGALLVLAATAATLFLAASPADRGRDLVKRLRSESGTERMKALEEVFKAGEMAAPAVWETYFPNVPVRPVRPRSFATLLKANASGERDVTIAARALLLDRCRQRFAGMKNPKGPAPAAPGPEAVVVTHRQIAEEIRKEIAKAPWAQPAQMPRFLETHPYLILYDRTKSEALVRLLGDESLEVRLAALRAVADFGWPVARVEAVVPFLDSENPETLTTAVILLARKGKFLPVGELLSRAARNPLRWAPWLAQALGYYPREDVAQAMMPWLSSGDWDKRLVAAGMLEALDRRADAEPTLIALLDHPEAGAAILAGWVLEDIGSPEAREAVRKKFTARRAELVGVYYGRSAWPEARRPEWEKAKSAFLDDVPQPAAGAPKPKRPAATPFTGKDAITLRDAVRLSEAAPLRAAIDAFARKVGEPPPAVGKAPAKGAPASGVSPDRYVYSIGSTLLSEFDPVGCLPAIDTCVKVILSRQLKSGLWSYRDPAPGEAQGNSLGDDAYESPNDFELPQAFYALSGLEGARIRAKVAIDPVVFRRALQGTLYTQNLDGGFDNYPNPEPKTRSHRHLTAWGTGMVAICLRSGGPPVWDDAELLVRGLIAREAGRRLLLDRAGEKNLSYVFPLRELAWTLGNAGAVGDADYPGPPVKGAPVGAPTYATGLPEPSGSATPPWEGK